MNTKINNLSFKGCQHLKKILIGERVNFKGFIDLSETPITYAYEIYKVNFDEVDGIISTVANINNRVKFKKTTSEMETQTDEIIEADMSKLKIDELTKADKFLMAQISDGWFWYFGGFATYLSDYDLSQYAKNEYKIRNKRATYLLERWRELKNTYNQADSPELKTFAEHVISLQEKIISNIPNFINMAVPFDKKIAGVWKGKGWKELKEWLEKNIIEKIYSSGSLEYKDIKKVVNNWTSGDTMGGSAYDGNSFENFYKSLKDTVEGKYEYQIILPIYDGNKTWEELTNNNLKKWCGSIKPSNEYDKGLRNDTYKSIGKVFNTWRNS